MGEPIVHSSPVVGFSKRRGCQVDVEWPIIEFVGEEQGNQERGIVQYML